MKNVLEELSHNNQDNYNLYLERMSNSMKHSTKGLIPILAFTGNNILDVGCGSGIVMSEIEKINPKAKITGLDLNFDAILKLKQQHNNWNLIHEDFMKLNGYKFDTIIFSSILHEISSYCEDNNKRFTEIPIKEAFEKSYDLLDNNGSVIVRDGLLTDEEHKDNKLIISFNNPEDNIWLYRFQYDFRGFDNLDINTKIIDLGHYKYMVSEGFLKEFLCTYTWGEASYPREVNERFGILTKNTWLELLNETGFKIEKVIESKEEYQKYLSKKIIVKDEHLNDWEYPNMSILIKARKK